MSMFQESTLKAKRAVCVEEGEVTVAQGAWAADMAHSGVRPQTRAQDLERVETIYESGDDKALPMLMPHARRREQAAGGVGGSCQWSRGVEGAVSTPGAGAGTLVPRCIETAGNGLMRQRTKGARARNHLYSSQDHCP